jgi:predicted AAA+ superfamily ATPase
MLSPLIERHLHPLLSDALTDTPAVLVNGPRQCGKTTLVRQYANDMPYFSLDDPSLLAAVRSDPLGFVRQLDQAIIDEIQRAPELLLSLKLMIDQDRRAGRFLLTGSANLMTLPTITHIATTFQFRDCRSCAQLFGTSLRSKLVGTIT